MKILYFFKKYDTYMYNWQCEHFVDELKHHGCNIDIFNPLEYSSINEANEMVLMKIKSEKYDLFMTCHFHNTIFPDTIDEVRKIGVPTLLFCPDSLLAPYDHIKVAPHFDLVWITAPETEYIYKKIGARTVYLPYAANPYMYHPNATKNEINKVAFIGTAHGSRAYRINQLLDGEVDVVVHTKTSGENTSVGQQTIGNYFQTLNQYIRYPVGRKLMLGSVIEKIERNDLKVGNPHLSVEKPLSFDLMGEMMGRYALMLSFSEAKSTAVLRHPVPIINLRHFEIPMAGGIQFTTYSEEIAEYFEDGKEIVLARDWAEYTEKAKFYTSPNRDALRASIRQAARARAEQEHTWMNRFSVVFDILGVKYC